MNVHGVSGKDLIEMLATARAEGHKAGMLRAAEICRESYNDLVAYGCKDAAVGVAGAIELIIQEEANGG